MSEQTINENNHEEQIISNNDFNDDRTMAFKIMKTPHRSDSIAWIVTSFFMFAFLVISVGRLTVVGQFLDDVIFSFLFGWMKYLAYFFLFGFDLAILIGIKAKFKIRFILMLVFSWFSLAWIMSSIQIMTTHSTMWEKTIFVDSMNRYLLNWKNNSIFGAEFQQSAMNKFLFWNYTASFINYGQSGGIIGTVFSAAFAYLSIPASFVLAIFSLFLDLNWILTGNPVYLFLSKKKRKGKRVRLLALKNNDNPYQQPQVHSKRDVETVSTTKFVMDVKQPLEDEIYTKQVIWDEITMMNQEQNSNNSSAKDQTFEFKNYEDELDENFYYPETKKSKLQSHEEFLEAQKAEFENLNPDQVRDKFAREFSNIRPYSIEDEKTVKNFVPFKEATLDDTDFLNDLASETHLPELGEDNDLDTTDLIIIDDEQDDEIEVETNYVLPSIDLLDDVKHEHRLIQENEAYALEKKTLINETFNQFKVAAKVVDIIYGPAVIKFEVLPEPGTKVNSISALENDLKLALASQNIRIEAPIPGKNLVGIEIENQQRLIVGLKEIMSELNQVDLESKLLFAIGKDVQNQVVFGDLAKMPHLLVAGSTGSGKSVMINTLIVSLLMRATPKEVRFLLIDPKKVELAIYSNLPHMLMPVISDMKQANKALKIVIGEMERRYELFAKVGAKNLDSFNHKQTDETKKLPYYVIIIDELADLMMTANKKEVEDSIMRITQMARAAGIHLIVATQRPSVDVLTGVIKANIPTRIAFSVATSIDSRTILDSGGAEKLTGKGDMLYVPPGSSDLIRAQGAYLSDEEIEQVIDFISHQQHENYQTSFLKELNLASDSNSNNDDNNQEYEEIKAFVIKHHQASASLIQRKFKIGYNKAANYLDQLEEDGIVGPSNGSFKGRTVLVSE